MFTQTLAELKQSLAKKEVSSVELVNSYIARIKKYANLNTFITLTEAEALEDAKQADKLYHTNQAKFLTGIPFAHKDIFCTKGIKTSCGSKMLDNFVSPYNATVVDNCANAGLISLGKTNMDEFAMGSSTETSFYGNCLNPWNTEYVPGGSSGGSAAAVAARLVPGATSTDTGGSIRQPASLCGVTGLKPTYGRVSRYGMIAFASSLDQGGPMAQTAEDCALLLEAMAGFDPKDSTSVDLPVPNYSKELNNSLENKTIGLPKEFFDDNLNPKMANILENAIKEFEKLGAKIRSISLPNNHYSVPVYYIIAPAECSSNLSRYDGVRFGYRCKDPKNLEDLYSRSRAEGFGEEVKRRILVGTYALSAGFYDAYYLKAQKVRQIISNDFKTAFQDIDIIIGPTAPSEAFKIGEKAKDPISMYLSDTYTIGANLAGLPAMSLPGGFINNLPAGIQLIGNYFAEGEILNFAHKFQQVTDWHKKMPTNID
jgi:aspartyl-tRNA(Asn)/glutamyl-tRNA(Gln) amidotransferase subunit A